MKKLISTIVFSFLLALGVQAVPAHKGKVTITQPDGTTVTLRLHGDEYLHFTTTEDGYSVVKGADNFYRYARREDGKLVATDMVAHDMASRSSAEKAFLNSTEKYQAPDMTEQMQQMQTNNRSRQRKALAQHKAAQYDYNNFRGLLILVEFNDKEFSRDDYAELMNDMVNQENYTGYTDLQGRKQTYTGSVRDYFNDNSDGKFKPQFDVYGPVKINYSQYDANGTDNAWDLVRAAVNAVDDQVNFKNYDRDNDGYVDLVYFIFAGNGSNYSGNDSRLFWPHRSAFYYFRKDGVNLGDYASSVELAGWTDSPSTVKIDGIGTICHEFSHVLGLPDFYDTDYAQNGQSNDPGDWSVMAGGSYFNDGRTPVGYSLFERFAVGFANVTTITGEGSYTLENIDNSNTGFRLKTSVDKESFYLENRQRTKWNYYLPGTGMLVFRVDSTSTSVWDYNTVNANPSHNYYEMLRAGGWRNGASSYDPFPGSGNVRTLNNGTSPANLLPWSDGGTQWGLKNIRQAGGVVYFDIEDAYVLKSISIDETLTLGVGMSRNLTVTYDPCYIEEEITWTSSNKNIATVDAEGRVTGVKAGTCTITATAKSGPTATCQVTVENELMVNSIAEFKALEEGTKAILNLKDARVLYVYKTDVYIRDNTGAIVFSNVGGTFRRWNHVDGKIYGQLAFENRMPKLKAVAELTTTDGLTIASGTEFAPREVKLEDLTEADYADYVVVKTVELIRDGGVFAVAGDKRARLFSTFKITGLKVPSDIAGKRFDVTCIFGTNVLNSEVIDECYLLKSPEEVEWTPVIESLTLTEKQEIVKGSTVKLVATILPEGAAGTLTWESDNEEVATVDAEGNVKGVSCGTATITVTAEGGVSAKCNVIVTAVETQPAIGGALELNDGDIVAVSLTEANVLYVHGENIYVRDHANAAVFNVPGLTAERTNLLSGKVYLQLSHVNRMPVFTPVEGWTAASDFIVSEGEEVEPRRISIDGLTPNYYADYVCVTATPLEGTDDVYAVGTDARTRLFNYFGIEGITLPENLDLFVFNVTGIFGTDILGEDVIDELYLLESPEKTYDLNHDGKISTADIQVLINEMKKAQEDQDMKYDLNMDGKVSTADIQIIINEMKK